MSGFGVGGSYSIGESSPLTSVSCTGHDSVAIWARPAARVHRQDPVTRRPPETSRSAATRSWEERFYTPPPPGSDFWDCDCPLWVMVVYGIGLPRSTSTAKAYSMRKIRKGQTRRPPSGGAGITSRRLWQRSWLYINVAYYYILRSLLYYIISYHIISYYIISYYIILYHIILYSILRGSGRGPPSSARRRAAASGGRRARTAGSGSAGPPRAPSKYK